VQVVKLDHNTQMRMSKAASLDKDFYKAEPDPEDNTMTVITIRTRRYQVT